MAGSALVIVNRDSRQGQQDLDPALALLRSRGIRLEMGEGLSAEEASGLIRTSRGRVDCVLVGGGDGTLQGVASVLHETSLPLGILPLGTANDLAISLGVPSDLLGAAEIIVAGKVRRIDLASANDVLFFNVAHIGLAARVNARLTKDVKQRWGRWSYLRTLLSTVGERRSFTVAAMETARDAAEHAEDPALMALLREFEGRRKEQATALEQHIRLVGLPQRPDPERQLLAKSFTHLKAALSRDRHAALVDAQQQSDHEILQACHKALDIVLPEETRQLLTAIVKDIIDHKPDLAQPS
jgi:hypothetical protein